MAELIDSALGFECTHYMQPRDESAPGGCGECWELAQKVADMLAANGYGKLPTPTQVRGERARRREARRPE